jgi:hypothetical protein
MEECATTDVAWNAMQTRLKALGRISFPCVGFWAQKPLALMQREGPTAVLEFLRSSLDSVSFFPSAFAPGVGYWLVVTVLSSVNTLGCLSRPFEFRTFVLFLDRRGQQYAIPP